MGDLHQISKFLLSHWQQETRCENLPADLQPSREAEAYAVQACMEQLSAAHLWGWKIAATSVEGGGGGVCFPDGTSSAPAP